MQDNSRYAVGLDIGTTTVRAVVAHLDGSTGTPTIVGTGSAPNTGMRKGTIVHLSGPAQAIDTALGDAERMSGYEVNEATVSINGTHIVSTHADGMIAVGAADHEINPDDVARIEDVATVGKVPANREILEVIPHSYRLDGQDNIRDPLGMVGTRLELDAHVVSVLSPYFVNLERTMEMAKVTPTHIVPTAIAAGRAVLSEQQKEGGVALVDIGGATTSIAIYDEGDLQYTAVLPYGGVNITNDLAIGLKTTPEIAEEIKLSHASATPRTETSGISIKDGEEVLTFTAADIDEIVDARLEDMFEGIEHELKKAGYAGKLPNGVVLTGGSAHLKGMTEYTKTTLGLAARIGKPEGFGGVADGIDTPEYAAAVGLMLIDSETHQTTHSRAKKSAAGGAKGLLGGVRSVFSKAFGKTDHES